MWSIRNKTKIHLGTTGIHQLETDHFPPHAHFRPGWDSYPLPDPPLWTHSTLFLRKQEGLSGHGRLAKQGLFAQTLKTRVTKAALAQSTPSHSAGQDSQHGPSPPWILSAHRPASACPVMPTCCPPLGPPPGSSLLGWALRICPHALLSFLPPPRSCPVSQLQGSSWRAGPVPCIPHSC